MDRDVTRRSFIGGGILAAMTFGTGAFSLTGCAQGSSSDTGSGTDTVDAGGGRSCISLSTDVLVVGAGGAGVQAAISARTSGVDVLVIDKKQWGHCGNSGLHYSGRMTSSDFGIEGDNVETQLEDACIQGGYMIDQDLGVEVLQAYADDMVTLASENYGDLHFRDYTNGKPLIGKSSNKPRLWPGFKLNNMAYRALEYGVQVMDYCAMTKILANENGQVVGVTALDFRTGNLYLIRAKSIVLATGGDTGLWGAGCVAAKYGGGCENLVGDGHALAAPLGVRFRDLEFRSLYTALGIIYPTGFSNFGCAYCADMSTFADNDGNAYLKEKIDAGEKVSLREATFEWYKVVEGGKGTSQGGVWAAADSYLVGTGGGISKQGFSSDAYDQLRLTWTKNGYDLNHVEAAPQQIYDYGGIVTNIKGETGIQGLYAAGEISMHSGAGYGSMRMFSSALVMGKRAGISAAEFAMDNSILSVDADEVMAECDRVYGMLEAEPDTKIAPHELKHRIQDTAWKGSGAMRSEKRCNEALLELDEEERDLANVYIRDKSRICNLEWMEAISLANMITMARMDTLASVTRTESRGSHIRNEYPDMDNDNWLKNVYIELKNGSFEVSTEETNLTLFKPEPGLIPQGGGTLEDF